jgi:MYXO-CTERM domain-containing protein
MRSLSSHVNRRYALSSAIICLSALGAGGCSSPGAAGEQEPEEVGVSAAAITAQDAITRAEEWVTAKLLYCQSPNGANDTIDPACPPVCMRMSNPQWDPYRSDCSGLVSWAWGLPAPGRTTAEFAPNQNDITMVIAASSLQMGDAVNTDDSASSEHHIMLFKAWTAPGQTATFIEEPGCSSNPNYAHEFTSNVSINGTSITVDYNGITFQAIRYPALGTSSSSSSSSSGGPPPPTCQVNGVNGTCIDTSVCATMPGYVSTPGYCPGPASEQCCTPTGTSSTSGSSTSSSGSTSSGGSTSSNGSSGGGTGAGGATGTGGATNTGGAPGTGTSGSGASGAGGHHGTAGGSIGANSGCQASSTEPPGVGGLGLLAGLLLLGRRRRSVIA